MEYERYEEGVPSWVDLGSPDRPSPEAVYGGLFGWDCPAGPPEAGGYSVCELGGKTVAGLRPQDEPGHPGGVDLVRQRGGRRRQAARVSAHGGTVFMPPMDVMEAGRMSLFADPAGAVVGLWQPKEHTGAQLVNEPGALCWNELITTDLDGGQGVLQGGVRLGRRGPGPSRRAAGLHGVEACREVGRGDDAQDRGDARGDAAELGRCTSPWPTRTPPWPRPRSSAARC